VREGNTAYQTGKNLGSNSGLPQEAEGETDHLPENASNHSETMSFRFREWGGSTELCEPETQPRCKVSEESQSAVLW
jgi:hypothetical protein